MHKSRKHTEKNGNILCRKCKTLHAVTDIQFIVEKKSFCLVQIKIYITMNKLQFFMSFGV